MPHAQDIRFTLLEPEATSHIDRVAEWYASEWQIPAQQTRERLARLNSGDTQFQVLMSVDGLPLATGGLYNHVGILDKFPHLAVHRHWLALVYTLPAHRGRGYGALLCADIESKARERGLKELTLFTHTAESLYRRLGWQQAERIHAGEKNSVVMTKRL